MKKINYFLLFSFIIFSLKIYASNDFEVLKSVKINQSQTGQIFEIVKMNYDSNSSGNPVYDQIFIVMINNNEFIFFPTDDVPPVNSDRETHCDINILLKKKPIQEPVIKSNFLSEEEINNAKKLPE